MSPRESVRLAIVEREGTCVVVDRTGTVIAFATLVRAFRLVRLVHALELNAAQVERLLGEGSGRRLLRTIELRYANVCRRCGQPLYARTRARWNPVTGLAQHFRRCPAVATSRREAA
jgi:hypothetical protein